MPAVMYLRMCIFPVEIVICIHKNCHIVYLKKYSIASVTHYSGHGADVDL